MCNYIPDLKVFKVLWMIGLHSCNLDSTRSHLSQNNVIVEVSYISVYSSSAMWYVATYNWPFETRNRWKQSSDVAIQFRLHFNVRSTNTCVIQKYRYQSIVHEAHKYQQSMRVRMRKYEQYDLIWQVVGHYSVSLPRCPVFLCYLYKCIADESLLLSSRDFLRVQCPIRVTVNSTSFLFHDFRS